MKFLDIDNKKNIFIATEHRRKRGKRVILLILTDLAIACNAKNHYLDYFVLILVKNLIQKYQNVLVIGRKNPRRNRQTLDLFRQNLDHHRLLLPPSLHHENRGHHLPRRTSPIHLQHQTTRLLERLLQPIFSLIIHQIRWLSHDNFDHAFSFLFGVCCTFSGK